MRHAAAATAEQPNNPASVRVDEQRENGTYASGYPLEIMRGLRLAPEARVSRSSCQIGEVSS